MGELLPLLWTNFLVLFSFLLSFLSIFPPPISTPFLEVVFGLGPVACEKKREGACFPLEVKTALEPAGARLPSSCLRLASWSFLLSSKPRALHIILSCNSHCNCRNPDCWGSSYYYYYDYYCCCCCFSLITPLCKQEPVMLIRFCVCVCVRWAASRRFFFCLALSLVPCSLRPHPLEAT